MKTREGAGQRATMLFIELAPLIESLAAIDNRFICFRSAAVDIFTTVTP